MTFELYFQVLGTVAATLVIGSATYVTVALAALWVRSAYRSAYRQRRR